MSHEGILTLLGILVLLSPFLGLPYSWLMVIVPLLGLAVIAFSLILRMRAMSEMPVSLEPAPLVDEATSVVA